MISFVCESCGRKIRVQDQLANKRIKCPDCKSVLTVPNAQQISPVMQPTNPPQQQDVKNKKIPRWQREKKSSFLPNFIVIMSLIVIPSLFIGAILVFVFMFTPLGQLTAENQPEQNSEQQESSPKTEQAANKKDIENIPWEVQVDPIFWKLENPIPKDKVIQFPPGSMAKFPTTPSPYVAMFIRNPEIELRVYDMRTMEQVGETIKPGKIDLRAVHFSPWGDLFAYQDRSKEFPTVHLWSTKGKKVKSEIQISNQKIRLEGLDFAGPNEIMTVKEIREDNRPKRLWEVWDGESGEVKTRIHYQLEFSKNWISWTPSRRYLVMQETTGNGYFLLFWDLRTGKLAGKMPMQRPEDLWGQCGNITFTSDGKEAALTWRLAKNGILAKIMRFDVVNGKKIGEHSLRKEIRPSDPGLLRGGMDTFQCLPDNRGWLLCGHQIIARETGKVVWAIGTPLRHIGQTRQCRFLDGNHVVTINRHNALDIDILPSTELDAAYAKAK